MKILLINNNPVVSRLTALSARKEDIQIDEIQEVTELQADKYDIVFVDSDSWTKDVHDVISEDIKSKKLVLFYAEGDEEEQKHFDVSILKPFLPSEVSAVIRTLEENEENEENKNQLEEDLFDLNPLDEKKTSFDDKLNKAFSVPKTTLDDDLFDNSDKINFDIEELIPEKEEKTDEIKIDDDLFDLDLTDTSVSFENDLIKEEKEEKSLDLMDNLTLDKKEEISPVSLDDELVLEVDKPLEKKVEVETETETKILDSLEIDNIKGILEDDSSSDMKLDDLMPIIPTVEAKKEKVKKEKELEEEESLGLESNVLVDSLASMPVDSLRELLAGTKINIQIKFPKSK